MISGCRYPRPWFNPSGKQLQRLSNKSSIYRMRRKESCPAEPINATSARICDVAIVGGGLGGPAVAVGLRDTSLDWHVFESANELRTSTSTIAGQGKNSYSALSSLDPDLPDKLWSLGSPLTVRSEARLPGQETIVRGWPGLTVLQWADIQRSLAEELPEERVHCGHRAVQYSETGDGFVSVHFQNQEPIRARMVIAADGVRSAMRQCMLPEHAEPRYLRHMNWNTLVHMPKCPALERIAPANYLLASDGPFGAWTTQVHVMGLPEGLVFWQVRVVSEDMSFTAPRDALGRPQQRGPPGCKQRVLQRLNKLGWMDIVEVVEATPEALEADATTHVAPSSVMGLAIQSVWAEVLGSKSAAISVNADFFLLGGTSLPYHLMTCAVGINNSGSSALIDVWLWMVQEEIFERPLVDIPPLPRWSSESGRVLLLGDAAHGMHPGVGLGSRSAFEDADQLVQAIKAHWPDTHKIAQQYEAIRMPRATRCQQFSAEASALPGVRFADSMAHLSQEEWTLRNAEFLKWADQYPENMQGDPATKFWPPPQPATVPN